MRRKLLARSNHSNKSVTSNIMKLFRNTVFYNYVLKSFDTVSNPKGKRQLLNLLSLEAK